MARTERAHPGKQRILQQVGTFAKEEALINLIFSLPSPVKIRFSVEEARRRSQIDIVASPRAGLRGSRLP